MLEGLNLPLGVVSAIAGQTRLRVAVTGVQGHAGTVPMKGRADALAAAAAMVVMLEEYCREGPKDGAGEPLYQVGGAMVRWERCWEGCWEGFWEQVTGWMI